MIIDCAHYLRGDRQQENRLTLAEASALPRSGNSFVWIELHEPGPALMREICDRFGLHELAVEDAGHAHQRPKVEPYDDFHFIVFKTARYDEATRRIAIGELDLFLGVGTSSPCATARPATSRSCDGASSSAANCSRAGLRRSCGASSTPSSTTTGPPWRASSATSRTWSG